jgi:hypothetical protein
MRANLHSRLPSGTIVFSTGQKYLSERFIGKSDFSDPQYNHSRAAKLADTEGAGRGHVGRLEINDTSLNGTISKDKHFSYNVNLRSISFDISSSQAPKGLFVGNALFLSPRRQMPNRVTSPRSKTADDRLPDG